MSAICGIYYRDNRPVTPETGAAMMEKLGIYRRDASGTWRDGPVFLGCHSRWVTPESVGEVMPYRDASTGLTITADAVIDNREDLFERLGVTGPQRQEMPDGPLILKAYQKWGIECPRYLLGDFAFAIRDEGAHMMFCAVDHASHRTLHYYLSARLFVFSTLIEPLFVTREIERHYSKVGIADYLSAPPFTHADITLYENIYRLPAGHRLSVHSDKSARKVYWEAQRGAPLKLKSDGEYEEAFRRVLGEAVVSCLRSRRPVGMMLSGGLDSPSVACLAARELAKAGQRLKGFTSAPMTGYRDWLPPPWLADETPYVEAVRKHAGNIDVTYCRSEGKHALSDTDRLMAIREQPYKNFGNLFWIDTILAEARSLNIGVVLTGQLGNGTISWGGIGPYMVSLARSGQWPRFVKEALAFADRRNNPRVRTLLGFVIRSLPDALQKRWRGLRNRGTDPRDLPYIPPVTDSPGNRKLMLNPALLGQLGSSATTMGLAHNLIIRDPTADRRVIEFCLSVPEEQYVRDGQERFLLRRAMAGILPDRVRLNETTYGRQSADGWQRLRADWPRVEEEIRGIGVLPGEREYFDLDLIRWDLERVRRYGDRALDTRNWRRLIGNVLLSRFLKKEMN
jgi:asparagine synthase (glutamine-hydrolysing)